MNINKPPAFVAGLLNGYYDDQPYRIRSLRMITAEIPHIVVESNDVMSVFTAHRLKGSWFLNILFSFSVNRSYL